MGEICRRFYDEVVFLEDQAAKAEDAEPVNAPVDEQAALMEKLVRRASPHFRAAVAKAVLRDVPVERLLVVAPTELLRKVYSKLAHATHPDKGGNQEWFVELTEAWKAVRRLRGI